MLLDDGVKRCHYCGGDPNHLPKPASPYPEHFPPPRRKRRRGCLTALVVVLSIVVFSFAYDAIHDIIIESRPKTTTLPAATDSAAFITTVTSQLLRDIPEVFRQRQVNIRATVISSAQYAAGEDIYGTIFVHPVYVHWVEDASGLVVVVAPTWRGLWKPGSSVLVTGVFHGLREINGELVPLVQTR